MSGRIHPQADKLEGYATIGVERVLLAVPAAGADEVLPALDAYTTLLGAVR